MLLIGISTYNEIESLPQLVRRILEVVPDCRLLVVDDNSPDGTGKWCDEYAAKDKRLFCCHRAGKLGLGTATVAVLNYAVEHNFDVVVTMDADMSHDPRFLPSLIQGLEQPSPVDVVIGSRYVPGGGVEGWPWKRRMMSWLVNRFARFWLQLPAKDTSGAFRCYRVQTLRNLDLTVIISQGYSVFEELLWRLRHVGATMREVPITFVDRDVGQSKISLREAIRSVFCLIGLRFRDSKGSAKSA